MKIVSGRTGSPHVTSQQFRQMLEGILGQDSYILTSGENLKPELSSNNLLKIRSGMMCHHGCISCVEIGTYDEVTLINGSQGMRRIDLVVNRYTRNAETEIEKCEWKVITGTAKASSPAVPTYTKGNLQEGDLVDECPVFEIHYDGINVTEVKILLSTVGTVAELNDKSERKITYDETETGEFMLGKKVYSRSIWQTHLPNNGTEIFDTGLPADTYYAWIDMSNSYIYNGGYADIFPIPYVNPRDNSWKNSVGAKLNNNKLVIYTATDWAGYGFFITIKYVKR